MKWIISVLISAFILPGCSAKDSGPASHSEHGHHEKDAVGKSMLIVEMQPASAKRGEPVDLKMMVHDQAGKMISQFDVTHEKKAHLIIVRDGLDQFAHLHPEVDGAGNLTTTYRFPVGGDYHLFLDHKPTGQEQALAVAKVHISGDAPQSLPLLPNVPGSVTADETTAVISAENAKSGPPVTIEFHLSDTSGKPVVDLDPYLGAMGHLVVISDDAQQYVHAHPMEKSASPGEVAFMAHFEKPGLYKGWGQFQRAGTVRTIPFVIAVK